MYAPRHTPQHSTTWYGGDSEAWVERYGFGRFGYNAEEIRSGISEALRASLLLDAEGIRTALSTHLRSRLDEIEESIDFIVENAHPDRSREEALKAVQYWNADRNRNPGAYAESAFMTFTPQYTLANIDQWRREASAINGVADKLEMFNWFADIEDEFEPLEELLNKVAGLIDSAIQDEIDRIRGK